MSYREPFSETPVEVEEKQVVTPETLWNELQKTRERKHTEKQKREEKMKPIIDQLIDEKVLPKVLERIKEYGTSNVSFSDKTVVRHRYEITEELKSRGFDVRYRYKRGGVTFQVTPYNPKLNWIHPGLIFWGMCALTLIFLLVMFFMNI